MTIKNNLSRRQFISQSSKVAAAGLAGGVLPVRAANPHSDKRPNVLFIMSDQERNFTHLPDDIDLPAHDYLRKYGVAFEQYYVNTSPCSPSRSVIYSGQHTMNTGVTANLHTPPYPQFDQKMKTLGHYLQEQGYYTAYKGKWHLSDVNDSPDLMYGQYPSQHNVLKPFGFQDFNLSGDVHGSVWSGRKMDNIIASEACDWLAKKGKRQGQNAQPWCLSVNFVNPHDIMFYCTGEAQRQSRLRQNFMAPIKGKPAHHLYGKNWDHVGLPNSFSDDLKNKPWAHQSYKTLLDDIFGQVDHKDEKAWLDMQGYYFNCIRDVSRQADMVIQQLASIGELDNTIIIYSSDHGEMAGAHGLRQKGPTVYKENSNVPLIIKHPDIKQNKQVNKLASSVDLVPSILEMVGLDKKDISSRYPELAGVSIMDALENKNTQRDEQGVLFAYGVMLYTDPEFTRQMISSEKTITPKNIILEKLKTGSVLTDLSKRALHRGIFDGRYKFTRYFSADSHHLPDSLDQLKQHNDLELYDTWQDPDEMKNLAQTEHVDWSMIDGFREKTNELITKEIGNDFGSELLGPEFLYKL
jgi:arylsulfatase